MSLSFTRSPAFHTIFLTLLLSLTSIFRFANAVPVTNPETTTPAVTDLSPRGKTPTSGYNDYSCRSPTHPNPVIFIHGLLANEYDNFAPLAGYLRNLNFCTFGLTYGSYPLFPIVGGLKSVDSSSKQVASFVQDVLRRTGAKQVDLVGHSEGAFMSLYLPKLRGLGGQVRKIVALAPPTHGTDLSDIYDLAYAGGDISRQLIGAALNFVGCAACNDLCPDGSAVASMTDGKPIVQPGNSALIIASRKDHVVTPPQTAFVDPAREVAQGGSVTNMFVQDECPNDLVGHAGLAYDPWVWERTANWLDPGIKCSGRCYSGLIVKE